MKYLLWGAAICMVSITAFGGQQRPTLRPSQPAFEGLGSSQTVNPHLLLRMRKVYIQRIDNGLSERLAADLARDSEVKVVDKSDEADAIVRGTCFRLQNLKRLHAEVYINDRITGKSIWQDVVRVPYNPPTLPNAVTRVAAEVLAHLNQSIRVAANPRKGRY